MKKIDQLAIAGDLSLGYQYMNRAAYALFDLCQKLRQEQSINDIAILPKVYIFTGKGNNGGDGIVLAKLLDTEHYEVKVLYCGQESDIHDPPHTEADLAAQHYGKDKLIFVDANSKILNIEQELLQSKDCVIVDALLGIGSKGEARGLVAEAINSINKAKKHNPQITVIAVDLSSGVDADQAICSGACVQADFTVAMGFPKIASLFYPAKAQRGHLLVQNLDYPPDLIEQNHLSQIYSPTKQFLKSLIPVRKADGSKFDHGSLLLFAGSQYMSGAAMLASSAALRSGLGMLYVLNTDDVIERLSVQITEAVYKSLGAAITASSMQEQVKSTMELIEARRIKVLAMGPGLSQNHHTASLICDLAKAAAATKIKLILDADAINAFVDKLDELQEIAKQTEILITPHQAEYQRLFALEQMDSNPLSKIEILKEKAQTMGISILLKGTPTLLADPNGKVVVLAYGNTALAKAGSGDVLTGIISSLAAQRSCGSNSEACLSELSLSACLGAYLQGTAASLLSEQLGEYTVIASDLPKALSQAFGLVQADSKKL